MEQKNRSSAASPAWLFMPALTVLTLLGLGLTLYSAFSGKAVTSSHWSSDIALAVMYAALLYYALRGFRIPHGNLLRYCFLLFALTDGALVVIGVARDCCSIPVLVLDLLGILLSAYIAGRLNKYQKNRFLMPLVALLFLAGILLSLLPNTVSEPAVRREAPVVSAEPMPAPAPAPAPAPEAQPTEAAPTLPPVTDTVPTESAPAEVPAVPTAAAKSVSASDTVRSLLKTGINELVLWLCLCLAYVSRYREHREAGLS